MGAYLRPGRHRASRCSAPSCSTASTSSRRYRFTATDVFTNKTPTDAYRGAGRPEATFAIERLDGRASPPRSGMDPLELRRKNWINHEEFPFTTMAGMTYDSGNYEAATARAMELFDYDGLRAEQEQRRTSRGPGPARHRHLHLHRDVRAGAVPAARCAELRGRRLGDRHRADAAAPARSRWSPGPARTVRATRQRGARSSPTGSACRSRTSRCCTATPRSPREGLDTYGSRSLAVGGVAVVDGCGQGDREGQGVRRAHARGERRRHRVRRRAVHGARHRQGGGDRGGRLRRVRRAQPAGRRGAESGLPMPRSTRRTSPSRTARTCARSRWTPRPARRPFASTSASTTSAG